MDWLDNLKDTDIKSVSDSADSWTESLGNIYSKVDSLSNLVNGKKKADETQKANENIQQKTNSTNISTGNKQLILFGVVGAIALIFVIGG